MAVIHVHYYTDPACPWSWAMEPTLRRLEHEFGDELRIAYVMGGMARQFGEGKELIRQSLEAAAASGMPVDARIWLDGAPSSSYPACMAVKAAAEQHDPGRYLRRLREGLLCRRRKLDTAEALVEEARAVGGLDIERFRVDLASHAILEALGADLDRAAAVAPEHHTAGTGRVRLPSLEFRGAGDGLHGVYGYGDYATLRDAALAAGARPSASEPPSIEQAFARWDSLGTAEVAAVCRLPGPRAPAELWARATEWRLQAERVGSGELWTPA